MVDDVEQLFLHFKGPITAITGDPYGKPGIDGQDERQDGDERHKPDVGDAFKFEFVEVICRFSDPLYSFFDVHFLTASAIASTASCLTAITPFSPSCS